MSEAGKDHPERDSSETVSHLLDQWAEALVQVVESMTDQRPALEWRKDCGPPPESGTEADLLWWEQPFQISPAAKAWVAAPPGCLGVPRNPHPEGRRPRYGGFRRSPQHVVREARPVPLRHGPLDRRSGGPGSQLRWRSGARSRAGGPARKRPATRRPARCQTPRDLRPAHPRGETREQIALSLGIPLQEVDLSIKVHRIVLASV
jgi:hypothetical protein